MLTYREIDRTFFPAYDRIPMKVMVDREYRLEKIDNGLGGFFMREVAVRPYIKDLGRYEVAMDYEKDFDISNWKFFMAFDGDRPVGAATLVSRTKGLNMLDGRDDLCLLWDIRVDNAYQHNGIGQKLFDLGVEWAKKQGFAQMKIECQNNNVPACRFYHKQGAVLSAFDAYAYYGDATAKDEIQLIWYLDFKTQERERHGR